MKITYSILWIDDEMDFHESLQSDREDLKEKILSWGFHPEIDISDGIDDFRKAIYKNYDLMLVDLNLSNFEDSGEVQGQNLIQEVRDSTAWTEVIFYSSDLNTLWGKISKERLEGLHVSHKDDIMQKIPLVIEKTMQKVLGLENVRGIVMAEVGKIDGVMREFNAMLFEKLVDDSKGKMIDKWIGNMKDQKTKDLERIERVESEVTIDDVGSLLSEMDSMKLWEFLRSINKVIKDKVDLDQICDYGKDVLAPRNFLAHGEYEKQSDGTLIFSFRGNDFHFTKEVSAELRGRLIQTYGFMKKAIDDNAKAIVGETSTS